MEFVKKNIGSNKVTLSIYSNEFDESHAFVESPSYFHLIEDPIEKFKSKPSKILIPAALTSNVLTGFHGFVACILESLDPMCRLLSIDSLMEKIKTFEDRLVIHIDQLPKNKKTAKDVKDAIQSNFIDDFLMNYTSFVVKRAVALCKNEDWTLVNAGDYHDCVMITLDENGSCTLLSPSTSITEVKKQIVKDRIEYLWNNNIFQKLNDMLVKDLRDIAERLWLPTFKVVEHKKKNYLKNELKEVIQETVQQYKQ